MQQRRPGGARGLLWEFPGGKVEEGEDDAAALVREGQEELGVALSVGETVFETAHAYRDLHVTLVVHRAHIVSGEPAPLACHALRWASPDEMRTLPFCEADVPFIQTL